MNQNDVNDLVALGNAAMGRVPRNAKLSDIDLAKLATLLTDCAEQVERAKPANPVWVGPDPDWFDLFRETVLAQVDASVECAEQEVLKLRDAAAALYSEYEQGQFSDHHQHHRDLWKALDAALKTTSSKED